MSGRIAINHMTYVRGSEDANRFPTAIRPFDLTHLIRLTGLLSVVKPIERQFPASNKQREVKTR